MLSQAIKAALAADPRRRSEIARAANISAGHLSRYLNYGATLSTEKLDALVAELRLELVTRDMAMRARLDAASVKPTAGDPSR